MSDTPKFEVIDRRKYKADEEEHAQSEPAAAARTPEPEGKAGPRLVTEQPKPAAEEPSQVASEAEEAGEPGMMGGAMPPAPSAEESQQQKTAYDASAQRLEDLVRAQNPGVGPQPPVTFDHLVQQLYLSAMIQMGAGTQEGQRARVDIVGARQTIDLLGILADKTKGNLTPEEDRILQTMLFEARMGFLELTNMITMQAMQPPTPPPGTGKR